MVITSMDFFRSHPHTNNGFFFLLVKSQISVFVCRKYVSLLVILMFKGNLITDFLQLSF